MMCAFVLTLAYFCFCSQILDEDEPIAVRASAVDKKILENDSNFDSEGNQDAQPVPAPKNISPSLINLDQMNLANNQ